MASEFSNYTNAMKTQYGPGWRNAINNSSVVWAEATKKDASGKGLEIAWSLHSGRSNASGARGEMATLPVADRQRHIKPRVNLAYQYHTIQLSGPVRHLASGNEAAFVDALDIEVKQGEKDSKFDMNRQTVGQVVPVTGTSPDGWYTGAIAQIAGAPSANVITLDDSGSALDASVMRHFFVGMLIDSITPATGAVSEAAMEITAIDVANRTITVDDDGSAADNDYIARSGAFGEEIYGLRALLSVDSPALSSEDFDYAGVDVSANPVWSVPQVGSTTTAISEVFFEEAGEKVETDGDGSSADEKMYVVEHTQRRKLASLLQARKQYDGRDMTLPSGWKGISLSRGTLVADRLVPSSYVFGIHRPELTKFIGLDFQWDEDDGEVFFKTGTKDAIEARFKGYVQLAATSRNCHVQGRLANPTF